MPRLLFAPAFALSLLLAACSTTSPTAGGPYPHGAAPVGAGHTRSDAIAPGEALEIYVLEDDNLSGRYLVRPSGHVILPSVGRVMVAGLTPSAAEAAIRKSLEGTQIKHATVMVERGAVSKEATPDGVTAFFSGSVNTPGRRVVSYVSGRRPTLYQGILEAGGFNRFADRKHVTVTRNTGQGSKPIIVDLERVVNGSAADLPLEDGDVVTVKEKAFGW